MDLFDLAAKITLDSSEYEKGIGDVERSGADLGGKLKSLLGTTAKVTAAAITGASAAVGALVKQGVEAYATYEQLVGGVETLFGAGGLTLEEYASAVGKSVKSAEKNYNALLSAQKTVLENAANAYKTAGLSANEYIETVTSVSASLIASVGGDTQKAAEYADMAITDMADNANKMGSSIESIQNAYSGFAKQNYTMLDNLKLGYGGTKTEMERLIADAEALDDTFKATRDENGDLAMSYADIVDAIHIVQTNMGITGTTAEEASKTIAGSVSAAKAAWKNLVIGIADENADLESLIGGFVESVGTAADNILPRIEKGLQGVGSLISKLGPIIAKAAPELVRTVLPTLLKSAADIVRSIAGQLPGLITSLLSDTAPDIIAAGSEIITTLITSLAEAAPELVTAAFDAISALADGLVENLPLIIEAAVSLIITLVTALTAPENVGKLVDASIAITFALVDGLITAIPQLIEAAPEIIANLVVALIENAPKIFEASIELIFKLVEGLFSAQIEIWKAGPQLILQLWEGIKSAWDRIKEWGAGIIDRIGEGFTDSWKSVKDKGGEFIDKIWEGIQLCWKTIKEWGPQIIDQLWAGITDTWDKVKTWAGSIFDTIAEGASTVWKTITDIGKNIVEGIWQGISDAGSWLYDKLSGWVGDVLDWVGDLLGIASPSKEFAKLGDYSAKGFVEGMDDGLEDGESDIKTATEALVKAAKDGAAGMDGDALGSNFGDSMASGIKGKYETIYNAAASIARAASNAVKRTLQIASPSKVAAQLGEFFGEGMALGVEDEIPAVAKAAREMSDALTDPINVPEISYNASVDVENNDKSGIMQQLLSALSELKEGLQITVYLDDGTLITRIDEGLGTISRQKARGNA